MIEDAVYSGAKKVKKITHTVKLLKKKHLDNPELCAVFLIEVSM